MLVDALEMFLSNLRHIYDLVKLMIEALAITHVDLSATTRTKKLINSLI